MYYSPFPAVADAVQSELEQYKQSEEYFWSEVTKRYYDKCTCIMLC